MGLLQRLTDLDDRAIRRWPRLVDRSPAATLRMVVVYQAIALVEVLVGSAVGAPIMSGLAAGPLVLGIGAAWRLLHAPGQNG